VAFHWLFGFRAAEFMFREELVARAAVALAEAVHGIFADLSGAETMDQPSSR